MTNGRSDRPETLGPYAILERIGSGGMGEVYRAYDRRLDRHVAIKHIHPDSAEDPRIRRRLRREAHAVAKLNHPAIVQIYDILELEEGDWIVMELVEGRTLQDLARSGRLDLARALFLAGEVASGLAEAHSKGVVHRDLKTENVMITPRGHAKILDFGLAKLLLEGAGDTILSLHGTIVGTGRAMSPEQAKGDEVDHRSDLFSFGSLLYEVLTGSAPFRGPSIIATLTQICGETQAPAAEIEPRIPLELSDLVDRLLEKRAVDRPDDTAAVAAQLARIASRLTPEEGALRVGGAGAARTHSSASLGAALPASRPESSTSVVVKTLVSVALDGASGLAGRLGDARAREVWSRHTRLVRDLLAHWGGTEVSVNGRFLLVFERPADAVELALDYHRRLALIAEELGVTALRGRVGIHLGEIAREDEPSWGEAPFEVEPLGRRIVARTADLAQPGQTLVTQAACSIARRTLDKRSDAAERAWIAHGKFRFAKIGTAVRIFEVRDSHAPDLPPPVENERARRVEEPGEDSDPRLPGLRSRRRRSRIFYAAAAVGALAVVAAVLFRLETGRGGVPRPGESRTIAFAAFVHPDDGDEASLATTLAEMLAGYLGADGALRRVDGPDADYRLAGSYRGRGRDELSLRLEVRERSAGRPLVVEESGPVADLVELASRAGARVRRELRLARLGSEQRLAFRATWSRVPDAARLYAEGLAKDRLGDPARARDAFRRAIAYDPGHAPGHAALSGALLELDEPALAAESARRALELGAGLPRLLAARLAGQERWAAARRLLAEHRVREAREALEEARSHFVDAGDRVHAVATAAEMASLVDSE